MKTKSSALELKKKLAYERWSFKIQLKAERLWPHHTGHKKACTISDSKSKF